MYDCFQLDLIYISHAYIINVEINYMYVYNTYV